MRILAVDDDQGTRTFVSRLLMARGYEVDSAADGQSAMDLVRQHPYDLAVLDYEMPLLNGVELFYQIAAMRPQTLGVFLTAHARLDVVFPAIDAGVMRVLSKPIDAGELVSVIEDLIGRPVES